MIAGAEGQVGRELAEMANSRSEEVGATEFKVFALGRKDLDITKQEDVNNCIEAISPEVVVNAAAYTAVDKAEEEKEKAYAVNHIGPRNLAIGCAHAKIPLIHISTDYVFDGNKNVPYTEDDTPNPLGVYGESKLAGEKTIQEILERHYILRTSWVFGRYGSNFVKTMLRVAESQPVVRVVSDQFGSPTSSEQIAEIILAIASRSKGENAIPAGIYHFGGQPHVSWHQFALEVLADVEGVNLKNIIPIPSSEYPTPALRPKYTCLNNSKLKSVLLDVNNHNWRSCLQTLKNKL